MNLGQTLLAAKSVRADWEYFGFEPNPSCVHYVNALVEANDLDHCAVYPFGIGATTGAVDLRSRTVGGGEGSLVEGILPDSWFGRRIKVAIIEGAFLPPELVAARWGVLKVDVEDAELEVFRTLMPFIERDQPYIVTELLPTYGGNGPMAIRRERQDAVVALLQDAGYQMIRLQADGRREPVTVVEQHSNIEWSNYLFVPSGAAYPLV
ncbi:MAG: FkbM family methyltransferase [Chloroflexi bacterium]|nr:FkbM family methyltransferase [Chloroflexota bacterium]MDA1145766.1 FkbM family methyltransferase [Chloroflexota bacterium]